MSLNDNDIISHFLLSPISKVSDPEKTSQIELLKILNQVQLMNFL